MPTTNFSEPNLAHFGAKRSPAGALLLQCGPNWSNLVPSWRPFPANGRKPGFPWGKLTTFLPRAVSPGKEIGPIWPTVVEPYFRGGFRALATKSGVGGGSRVRPPGRSLAPFGTISFGASEAPKLSAPGMQSKGLGGVPLNPPAARKWPKPPTKVRSGAQRQTGGGRRVAGVPWG